MTDRPIIFSAPMVRALLEGRKSQTRRLLKPQPVEVPRYGWDYKEGATFTGRFQDGSTQAHALRFWAGDRLWVREAHALLPRTAYRASVGTGTIDQREHPTDGYTSAVFREGFDRSGRPLWRPSIHMPRWASRLTLTVTDVRVQRLQEISEEDARAEGIVPHADGVSWWCPGVEHPNKDFPYLSRATPREMFAALWDVIHGSGEWLGNPWIVALTFTVERRNIDAPPTDLAPLVLHEMEDGK